MYPTVHVFFDFHIAFHLTMCLFLVGAWVEKLGMGFADKYIGTPDSIAFRMPDNTATLHLIDQTGPLAISSANPTGEPDTTHHLQSFARLGIRNVSFFKFFAFI